MELRLERKQYRSGSTIGLLYVDDFFECYTLEDGIRTHKVAGETAIPAGDYRVVIDYSNRFKKELPHILDVPGFEGIRIHPGNAPRDTLGCILVGKNWRAGAETIADSRVAFAPLLDRLRNALAAGDSVRLRVLQQDAPADLAARALRPRRPPARRKTAARKAASKHAKARKAGNAPRTKTSATSGVRGKTARKSTPKKAVRRAKVASKRRAGGARNPAPKKSPRRNRR